MGYLSFIPEIFNFLIKRKKYWLIPLVVILLLMGLILMISESSAVSSLIYSLF